MLQIGAGGGMEKREGRVPLEPPMFNIFFSGSLLSGYQPVKG